MQDRATIAPLQAVQTQFTHPALPPPQLPLFTPTPGNGYCFPKWQSGSSAMPKATCPDGYTMLKIGKCVKRTYRKVDVCFMGPVCMAPFNETGTPQCFDDKVMQVGGARGRFLPEMHTQWRVLSVQSFPWHVVSWMTGSHGY